MTPFMRKLLVVAIVLLARVPTAGAQYRFEVVHPFASSGPRTPSGPLLETADGGFYGTTPEGGAEGGGVVFQLLPDGSIVTRDLAGATTGRNPYGGLVRTADGTLYGTTKAGGANSSGTFFAITPSGTFLTYDLPRVVDSRGTVPSSGPVSGPMLAADGSFYAAVPGITCCSPAFVRDGGIVRLTPQGVVTKMSVVPGSISSPTGPLVAGPGGYLYGTAANFGGIQPFAFRFLPSSGQSEILHNFTVDEASRPTALVLGPDGNLYGAASGLTVPDTVFRMTPSGSVAVLHQFQAASEGTEPAAPLMVGGDGNLYGVTSRGGAFDAGTIFRISLTGAFEVIYTFTGGDDGGRPLASLIESRDGSLYGTASIGGPDGGGVVFRVKASFSQPLLSIDIPLAGTVHLPFEIGGWAIDRGAWSDTGIDAVHVYAFPPSGSPTFLGAAPLGFARPDVAAAFGPQFANSGWLMKVTTLSEGTYTLVAFGHSTVTGRFDVVAQRTVTLLGPLLSIDSPAPGAVVPSGTRVFVGGWAIDRGAETGTGIDAIHVWIYPNGGAGAPFFAGVATYGVSRPDVGAAFGSRFTPSGYELDVDGLAPGDYVIAVFGHSTATNSFVVMKTRAVTISP